MPPRLHVPQPLQPADDFDLPEGPARHVQVLRLQPGAPLVLFDGQGGEWAATVQQMGRSAVKVSIDAHTALEREIAQHVTLAIGMPANERMDALVEKAAELGAMALQPLLTERSVLRLQGERAVRRQLHWQAIAVSACEQSGRNRLPAIEPVRTLTEWLGMLEPSIGQARWVLSLREAMPLAEAMRGLRSDVLVLSGPEGGLSDGEETLARSRGFMPVTLGPRTLRADTAPLAVLSAIALAPAPD